MKNKKEKQDLNPSKDHPEAYEKGIKVSNSTPNTPKELLTLIEKKNNRRQKSKTKISELTKISMSKLKELGTGPKEDIEIATLLLMRLETFYNYKISLERSKQKDRDDDIIINQSKRIEKIKLIMMILISIEDNKQN